MLHLCTPSAIPPSASKHGLSYGWLPEQYYRSKKAKFDDPVIQPTLESCWTLYDDTRCHKLKGRYKLPDEALKTIARYILFLHSDLEYKWPYFDTSNPLLRMSLMEIIMSVCTPGLYYRHKRPERSREFAEFQKHGELDFWPFASEADYKLQLNKQPFLKG